LKGGQWNTIPWDAVAAGDVNKGHPGILKGAAHYDAKARLRVDGLKAGGAVKVRFVEAHKVNGKWKVDDTAALQDYNDTAGDEYLTLNSGPDSMSKGRVLWLQVRPTSDCKLTQCAVKAFTF